jgi:hypothetical protein
VSVPYSSASTGTKTRAGIIKVLRRFGCEAIRFMDEFETHEVLLAFEHRASGPVARLGEGLGADVS